MTTFNYEAVDRDKGNEVVRGQATAESAEDAINAVLGKGLAIRRLGPEGGINRLMCLDAMTLCEPNEKPLGFCDEYGCGG